MTLRYQASADVAKSLGVAFSRWALASRTTSRTRSLR